jgi:hypothetical protein
MSYRGKYPHRIRETYSDRGQGLVARTNGGFRYRIIPFTAGAANRPPILGDDISHYIQSSDYCVAALDGDARSAEIRMGA